MCYNMNMKKTVMIVGALLMVGILVKPVNVGAAELSDKQKDSIVEHCDTIKENLKSLQHRDSRARVYLGRYYEIILNKFITPLNMRLVENNLVDNKLMDNQNNFSKMRTNFIIDYVEYQKTLEDLVATDCKNEPTKFYERLENVRLKRGVVSKDVSKLRKLAGEQMDLVDALKGTL